MIFNSSYKTNKKGFFLRERQNNTDLLLTPSIRHKSQILRHCWIEAHSVNACSAQSFTSDSGDTRYLL